MRPPLQKLFTVYQVTNQVNGKIYVGVHETFNPNDKYFGSGMLLRKAIAKYGREKFSRELIAVFESAIEMYKFEAQIVNEAFVARTDTYNLRVGGLGGWNKSSKTNGRKGGKVAAKVIQKLREDPVWRECYSVRVSAGLIKSGWRGPGSQVWLGRKHKEESKRKIGRANAIQLVGVGNSQYGTVWIVLEQLEKKISAKELSIFLENGWKLGRINKPPIPKPQFGVKNSQYNTCWITKDGKNRKTKIALLPEFIEKGWKRGREYSRT